MTDKATAEKVHPRDILVRTATRLFRERGYTGVGVAEMLETSGAPRGSLYFHFPGGKEQIAEAAVHLAGERMLRFVDNVSGANTTLEGFIDGLFLGWAEHLKESSFARGCAVALIALEASPTSVKLRAATDAVFNLWQERLAACGEARGLSRDAATRFAYLTLAAMQGGIVMCKASQSTRPLEEAALGLKAAVHGMRTLA